MTNPAESNQTLITNSSIALSERELQVIELVAAGLTNQDIAVKLEISKRTVDNHISNILTKTKTDNRVSLVRWALQWGKVCIDEVNCCMIGTQPIGKVLDNQNLGQELESA
jgi:DNA-binding NarL/FixJ family response regulator